MSVAPDWGTSFRIMVTSRVVELDELPEGLVPICHARVWIKAIHARPRFLLRIPVLRTLFRGKLVAGISHACRNSRLHLPGSLEPLNTAVAFRAFLQSLYRQAWVVYAKPPFRQPCPRNQTDRLMVTGVVILGRLDRRAVPPRLALPFWSAR
jgi:hypothetical protein